MSADASPGILATAVNRSQPIRPSRRARRGFRPAGGFVAPLALLLFAAAGFSADRTDPAQPWPKSVTTLVREHCTACHDADTKKGGLDLDSVQRDPLVRHFDIWERVVRRLETRQMPPATRRLRPDEKEYVGAIESLTSVLDADARAHPRPGRTETLRRLNRAEYQNAIRDLLSVSIDATILLPPDDASHGFDNVTVGTLSPTLLERYISAAQKISQLAVGGAPRVPGGDTIRIRPDLTQEEWIEGQPFGTRGGAVIAYVFPQDGEYEIALRLARDRNDDVEGLREPHELVILIDRAPVRSFVVRPPAAGEGHHGVDAHLHCRIPVKAGARQLGVAFVKQPSSLQETKRQPYQAHFNFHRHPRLGPALYQVSIIGPYAADGPGDTASRRRLFVAYPRSVADEDRCAEQVLSTVLRRAWRRPVTAEDVARVRPFFEAGRAEAIRGTDGGHGASAKVENVSRASNAHPGTTNLERTAGFSPPQGGKAGSVPKGRPGSDTETPRRPEGRGPVPGEDVAARFEAGIEAALSAILVSREFLFRVESDSLGEQVAPGTVRPVNDLDLASRLSFFLWSSGPDDELLSLAERSRLARTRELSRQTRRLLADARAESLVRNFASQWLHLRNLDSFTPDGRLFPDFDDNLRQALRRETELLFRDVLREDRSVLELLKTDRAWLNERLARHYGIPHVHGAHFRRVTLDPAQPRGGLLRQGSVLAVTSYATRTSPVLRGKWILENLIGTPPPPPAPNVPALDESAVAGSLPVRQRLAAHRNKPACVSCHEFIDPPGFALENFDALGRWRTREAGVPVDAAGGLPDGRTFTGVDGLEQGLLARPGVFVTALTEKLLTFALGRGIEPADGPAIRAIVRQAAAADYRFSAIILGIVNSPPFLMRQTP